MARPQLYHRAIHDTNVLPQSYWQATAPRLAIDLPPLSGPSTSDVAIIGGGYTGLSAALHLVRDHGLSVTLLEAGPIGWGASGRNGGFCCLGSSKLSGPVLVKRFGLDAARAYFRAQTAAISHVRELALTEGLDIDATGQGELVLAHRPDRLDGLKAQAAFVAATHGEHWEVLERAALAERHLDTEEAHGALVVPHGFGLHPLRYVRGLAGAAARHGARLHPSSEVLAWERDGRRHRLVTSGGMLTADKVLVATNGFYREGLHAGLDGRVLPALSSIVVTRPLSAAEQAAHRWTAPWLVVDTRALVFYIRLLADKRLLFGARGGTDASPAAFARRRSWMLRRLGEKFPAWADVPVDHTWWGLVALAADRLPHLAELDDAPGVWWAGLYHGAGVAMGTWFGRSAAARLAGRIEEPALPVFLTTPPPRFSLPALRLWLLRAAYLGYGLADERP